jgi:hypothetical protein
VSETQILEHRPAESFELNGQYCSPCTCGLRFTSTSPSLAHARWKKHAASQNPKSIAPTSPPARIRVCGCGCGEPLAPKAGGLFRSGHDARFKSVLTLAHAETRLVRHPATGQPESALTIADWLDERRGGGDFWRSKVLGGHKPVPERKPRPPKPEVTPEERGKMRVDALMDFLATRRPVPGDVGVVVLRSGQSHGARVIRRANEDALELRLLDGSDVGKAIVVTDVKFKKASP